MSRFIIKSIALWLLPAVAICAAWMTVPVSGQAGGTEIIAAIGEHSITVQEFEQEMRLYAKEGDFQQQLQTLRRAFY